MASQSNKHKLNTFHLFAGAGGGILADLLLGHNPIGACEIEPYPRDVLLARQRDGHLPNFPIWDDVCTLNGTPWRGSVDVLCGGFPCQDISAAGKGAGITGERSKLWKEYARLIGEMQPRFVFAENSPLLRTRGLGVVLEDLASLGYNARWGIIGARSVGAPHKRDRMWVLASDSRCKRARPMQDVQPKGKESVWEDVTNTSELRSDGEDMAYTNLPRDGASRCDTDSDWSEIIKERQDESQLESSGYSEEMAYAKELQCNGSNDHTRVSAQSQEISKSGNGGRSSNLACSFWHTDPASISYTTSQRRRCGNTSREDAEDVGELRGGEREDPRGMEEGDFEPLVGRVANGVANKVDRLKAIGNGQVPQCAAVAFNILSEGLI
jgi:DNA (cytosine-5)-methyltransferase 1